MDTQKIHLSGVQETLLLPLWGRAVETKNKNPLLLDHEAIRMIESIDYDFSQIEKKINPITRLSWVARSIYFDQKICEFLQHYPDATIINVGCGLDTTYERVNNGKAHWVELDFPDVINTRKQLLSETPNRTFLAYSLTDPTWYSEIKKFDHVLVMMAGVIYYFEEDGVKDIFATFKKNFKQVKLIFDYASKSGIQIANKRVIGDAGMDETAYLKWGIDDIYDLEKWNLGITVKDNMKMFAEHKKKVPFGKRFGMMISDALSVMSLAEIDIE